jgi:hypothetical protein
MMIVLSTILFGTPVSWTNALGILTVIAGSSNYSYVGYCEEHCKAPPPVTV